MTKPGRKSTASLSVVPVVTVSRLDPPVGLTDAQRALWVCVRDAKPVEWFTHENAPLLTEYVRAVDMCNRLAVQLERATEGGEVKALLDMRDKESRRVASIATKLRLTNQARYTPDKAAAHSKRAGQAKPWQFGSAS